MPSSKMLSGNQAAPAQGHRDPDGVRLPAASCHRLWAAAHPYPREPDTLQGPRRRTRRLARVRAEWRRWRCSCSSRARDRRRRHCGPGPASMGSRRTSSSSARWPMCRLCWTVLVTVLPSLSGQAERRAGEPGAGPRGRGLGGGRHTRDPDPGGGVLVPRGDPGALADALRSLLADPALATRLGAEGAPWSATCSVSTDGRGVAAAVPRPASGAVAQRGGHFRPRGPSWSRLTGYGRGASCSRARSYAILAPAATAIATLGAS